MHDNANITCAITVTDATFEVILALQVRTLTVISVRTSAISVASFFSLPLFLSLSACFSLNHFFILILSLFLTFSFSLCISLSLPLYLSLSPSVSLSLSLCIFLSPSVSLSLSICLSHFSREFLLALGFHEKIISLILQPACPSS